MNIPPLTMEEINLDPIPRDRDITENEIGSEFHNIYNWKRQRPVSAPTIEEQITFMKFEHKFRQKEIKKDSLKPMRHCGQELCLEDLNAICTI